MIRRLVVLTDRAEAPVLLEWVRDRAPDIEILQARDLAALAAAVGDKGAQTRLLAFLTDVIVPGHLLDLLGPEPYNIHPGPPDYPGSGPEKRALADGAREYGVTGHKMTPRVDDGPIVYVSRFDVPPGIGRLDFADQIFAHAVRAFGLMAAHCALTDDPLARVDVQWRRQPTAATGPASDMSRTAVDMRRSPAFGPVSDKPFVESGP